MARGGSSTVRGRWIGYGILLGGLISGVQSLDCPVRPFALPWENTTILNYPDRAAAHRSVRWQVGSNKQVLAMQLGTTLNSTFIPDGDKVCKNDGSTDEPPGKFGCVFWRGGLFQPASSKTWVKDTGVEPYNGSVRNEGWDFLHQDMYAKTGKDPLSDFPRGWDTITFGDNLEVEGYPMTIIDDGKFPFGAGFIGLASDSVFLKSAVHANVTPSATWSFDYGLTAADVAGELVVGGYNAAKAKPEDWHNFTVSADKSKPCPLQVTVSKMKWGSADLMAGMVEPFMACVEPAYWSMIMPYQVQQNFNDTMLNGRRNTTFWRATWEYFFYNLTDTLPDGDFTIELDTGFSVTMPRSEWIYDAVQINADGHWDKIPGSIQATLGTAGFAPGVTPLLPFLGAPFLSQAYLIVDYSTNPQTFALAKTNRAKADQKLVPLSCKGSGNMTTPRAEKKTPTGVIVGSAVGGFAVLAIVGAIIFCLFRRRKQRAEATAETNVFSGADPPKTDMAGTGFYRPPAYTSPGPSSIAGAYPPESVMSDNNSMRSPSGYSHVPSSPPPSTSGIYNPPSSIRRPAPAAVNADGPPAELSARPPSAAAFPGIFQEADYDAASSNEGSKGGK
ncbi:aspartic peptidase domain-containing protein [Tuber indicum]|nr:aspartic peptidase domain-containing protein [Tuber indicum]